MRECGTCTKCCEGHLSANIRGHEMFPGKPCFFVEIGKGCKDYENRPIQPCKNFSCGWKEFIEMPDEFKPDKSHVILSIGKTPKNKITFWQLTKAPNNPSIEMLSWAFLYFAPRGVNLSWQINSNTYYFGSLEFCEEAKIMFGQSV